MAFRLIKEDKPIKNHLVVETAAIDNYDIPATIIWQNGKECNIPFVYKPKEQ